MKRNGLGVSAGIGMGTTLVIEEIVFDVCKKAVDEESLAEEAKRLHTSIDSLKAYLEKKVAKLGHEQGEILQSHLDLLADPALVPEIEKIITQEKTVSEYAVHQVFEQFIQLFLMSGDELLELRATDLKDLRQNLLRVLGGKELIDVSDAKPGTVLVAQELSTSVAASINPESVVGIVTNVGGKTAHMAIIARSLALPAVVNVGVQDITDGMAVILDGTTGEVLFSPSEEECAEFTKRQRDFQDELKRLEVYRGQASVTKDGKEVELLANIGLELDIGPALAADGEGVGLFRTEFLYMDRSSAPSEDEQFALYQKAAQAFAPGPVIIRTLDVGGDKEIAYLGIGKEENPFLGYRAIRYCLEHQELFKIQLRGILRASAYGKVKIMLPMITTVAEFKEGLALVSEAKAELKEQDIPFDEQIEVGMMIETPAAAMMADVFAKYADFFSIGTNDLTQYTLSVDRGNEKVAGLYSTYDPAVLRMIHRVGEAAAGAGIMWGVCGEAAADPLLTKFFIACGVNELSMAGSSILRIRQQVLETNQFTCAERLAKELKLLETCAEAKTFLESL
ncbi:phosphotransferase system enzyme I (PtsI) [Lachnospiraceae bacterium PM6-15]|uniref:phosphoenolpyruvate--protein phosphotransferase n=1 Tax=Ohessyouella blattaphilus TaxID=2949333 RepID=UPI003E2423B8